MRAFDRVIFVIFMLFYGALTVFQFLSSSVFEGDFASQENSYQMFLYIIVYLILCLGIAAHLSSIQGQDKLLYFVMAYAAYYIISTLVYTFAMGYGSIKYMGTGVIMSSVSPFAFILFYFMGKENSIPPNVFLGFFLLLTFCEACCMVKFISFTSQYSNWIVVAQYYTLFLLLPLMLCYRNEILVGAIFLLFGLLTAYSAKRGAFLSLGAAIFMFYLFKSYLKSKDILIIVIYPIAMIAVVVFAMVYFVDFSYVMSRMDTIGEDRGSGRLDIYFFVWDAIKNSNIFELIFGRGGYDGARNVTLQIGVYGAHNDYLGLILDVGFIGLGLAVGIIVCLLNRFISLIRESSYVVPAFAVSLALFAILSNISTVFLGNFTTIPIWIFWGWIVGSMNSVYPGTILGNRMLR